jgi:chaperonin cofactor prefoldin
LEKSLRELKMATHGDVTEMSKRITNLEVRIDDIEDKLHTITDKLEDIHKAIRSAAKKAK